MNEEALAEEVPRTEGGVVDHGSFRLSVERQAMKIRQLKNVVFDIELGGIVGDAGDGDRILSASSLDGRFVDVLDAVPCPHLECTLSHLDDERLKSLARIHAEPSVFERLNRKALIEFVKEETLAAGYLEEVMLHLPPGAREWLFFLLDEDGMVSDVPIRPVVCNGLQSLGLVFMYHHDGQPVHVLSDDVRAAIKGVVTQEFLNKLSLYDDVRGCIRAALRLYGAIDADDLLEIVEQQNSAFDAEEVERAYFDLVFNDAFCRYSEERNLLINLTLAHFSDRQVLDFLITGGRPPRYLPSRERFLKYADDAFWEPDSEADKLRAMLESTISPRPFDPLDAFYFIRGFTEQSQGMSGVLNGLKELFGIDVLGNLPAYEALANQIAVVGDRTRTWLGNGRSYEELAAMGCSGRMLSAKEEMAMLLRGGSSASCKVGRNEPCPCGSGKKYKKCCGR